MLRPEASGLPAVEVRLVPRLNTVEKESFDFFFLFLFRDGGWCNPFVRLFSEYLDRMQETRALSSYIQSRPV